jgi:hypothetical protein
MLRIVALHAAPTGRQHLQQARLGVKAACIQVIGIIG